MEGKPKEKEHNGKEDRQGRKDEGRGKACGHRKRVSGVDAFRTKIGVNPLYSPRAPSSIATLLSPSIIPVYCDVPPAEFMSRVLITSTGVATTAAQRPATALAVR